MASRIGTILPAVIAGLLIGAVAMQVVTPPVSGTSVPSHGLTTSTGCADGVDPRAWIGVVPNSDHLAVYLTNYSATHEEADVDIRGELAHTGTSEWVLDIAIAPNTSVRAGSDCQPRSIIDAAIAVPPDAESLVIIVDGEPIAVVDTQIDAPRFAYLDE